jgi:NADH-quinone oxidoreductase subunit H
MRAKGLLGLLLILATASGCQANHSGPSLLNLTGMSPTEIELGDELEISGFGFPEGKPARVVFRGDLYRAGSKVEKDQEIVARTTSLSPRSLTLAVSDPLRAAFTGQADEARHTTFRGDIEVSFAPKKAGSAPVTGVLPDVVLDVEPELVSPLLQRQRDAAADAALGFLGLQLRASDQGDCCVVADVEGRSAAAGVKPGDKLVDMDGVTVRSRWDLVPSTERRTSRLAFRGDAGPIIVRDIDVQGYHSSAPSELGPAMGLIGFVVGLLLMDSTRLGWPFAWLTRWLLQRLRDREKMQQRLGRSRKSAPILGGDWLALPEDPRYHILGVSLLVGLLAVALAFCLRLELVSRELDLLLWCLLSTVSVVWATLLTMARQRDQRLRSTLRAASSALLHQLPLLALIVGSVFEVQSLRLLDLVDAQGAGPLGWTVFRSPAWLLLTLLAIVALVPRIEPSLARRVSELPPAEGRLSSLSFGLGRVLGGTLHLWSSATLLAFVAFGGFSVPWVSASAQSMSITWQLVGVCLLLAKSWGVVVLVVALRYVAGDLRIEDSFEPFVRYGLGLVALSVAGAGIWIWLGRTLSLGWLDEITAWVLFSTTFAMVGMATYRALVRARMPRSELGVNPWI